MHQQLSLIREESERSEPDTGKNNRFPQRPRHDLFNQEDILSELHRQTEESLIRNDLPSFAEQINENLPIKHDSTVVDMENMEKEKFHFPAESRNRINSVAIQGISPKKMKKRLSMPIIQPWRNSQSSLTSVDSQSKLDRLIFNIFKS